MASEESQGSKGRKKRMGGQVVLGLSLVGS